jgi:hypothetical protein
MIAGHEESGGGAGLSSLGLHWMRRLRLSCPVQASLPHFQTLSSENLVLCQRAGAGLGFTLGQWQTLSLSFSPSTVWWSRPMTALSLEAIMRTDQKNPERCRLAR